MTDKMFEDWLSELKASEKTEKKLQNNMPQKLYLGPVEQGQMFKKLVNAIAELYPRIVPTYIECSYTSASCFELKDEMATLEEDYNTNEHFETKEEAVKYMAEYLIEAVLRAMREPTDNMLLKGKNPIDAATLKAAQISITPELMKAAWQAMIDEAFK